MFRINEIKLGNYRSCVETRVEFITDLTALIGVNGAGKTNILMGLQLLKQLTASSYRQVHVDKPASDVGHSSIEVLYEIDKRPSKIVADLWFDFTETNDAVIHADMKYRNLSVPGSRLSTVDLEARRLLHFATTQNSFTGNLRYRTMKGTKKIDRDLVEFVKRISKMRYYSATQFSDPTKSPISMELDESGVSSRYGRMGTHERFLHDLYTAGRDSDNVFARYLNLVGPEGLKLVDDLVFTTYEIPNSSIKVGPGGRVRRTGTNRNIVVPNFIVDKLQLSPNQLSEGTYKTLALIFYILNDETDLLLVEEPEVCVHHGLLNSVIELLKVQSRYKQIVVSTHSDYVMDKLSPENVVVVRKAKAGTKASTLQKILPKTDLSALKKYLEETGNLGEYWKEGGFDSE